MSDRLISLDKLQPHPLQDIIPDPSPDEFNQIVQSIEENGFIDPITVTDDFVIIDGHTRWRAARAAGLDELTVIRLPVTDDQKTSLFFTLNVARRHMDNAKKRQLAKNVIKKWPKRSDRWLASMIGVSHPFVGAVRTELELHGEVETVTTREGQDGSEQVVEKPKKGHGDGVVKKKGGRKDREDEPEPEDESPLDFHCSYCGAEPGEFCTAGPPSNRQPLPEDKCHGSRGPGGSGEEEEPREVTEEDVDEEVRDRLGGAIGIDDLKEHGASDDEIVEWLGKRFGLGGLGGGPGRPWVEYKGGASPEMVVKWNLSDDGVRLTPAALRDRVRAVLAIPHPEDVRDLAPDPDESQEPDPEPAAETGDLFEDQESEDRREKIMAMIRGRLAGRAEPTVEDLYNAAAKIDPDIKKLTHRQFHARYTLQVKREKAQGPKESLAQVRVETALRQWLPRVPGPIDVEISDEELENALESYEVDEDRCVQLQLTAELIERVVEKAMSLLGHEIEGEPAEDQVPEPAELPV